MSNRYSIFKKLMDMVVKDYDITGANLNNYSGDIEISGNDGKNTIKIVVTLGKVKKDA